MDKEKDKRHNSGFCLINQAIYLHNLSNPKVTHLVKNNAPNMTNGNNTPAITIIQT